MFLNDIRFAFAVLRRQPGFAAVVIVTLALGIGANTALFSVADAVLFRPLPYRAPDRLVALWETTPRKARAAPANFLDWKRDSRSFEKMAAFGAVGFTLTGAGEAEHVEGASVGVDYFDVLGVAPELGRLFLARDEERGHAIVILGAELWQRRFNGDRAIVGRSVLLDGTPHTVIGVAAPGLYPSWPTASGRISFEQRHQQLFVPMRMDGRRAANRDSHVLGVVARLREDVGLKEAQQEMSALGTRLAAQYPGTNEGEGAMVTPLDVELLGNVKPALRLLLGAVCLVLLLACANVASVLLARAAGRERELAVRRALGASRGRVAALLLTESLLLSLLGGALGCFLAALGVGAVVSALPGDVPRLAEVAVNGRVLAFALLSSLLTGLAFGLGPSWLASSHDPSLGLKESGPAPDRRRQRARRSLVVMQVAFALVLLTGAELLGRSFDQLRRVDPGFKPEGILTFDLTLSPRYAEPAQITSAYAEVVERLRGLPAVKAATIAYDSPLASNWIDVFSIEDRPQTEDSLAARLAIVGPGYFETLQTPLVAGRPLDERDAQGATGAVVLSQAFVDRHFPGEDPLGHWLALGTPSFTWGSKAPSRFQIVGVATDVRSLGIATRPEPTYYISAQQFPQRGMKVLLKVGLDPLSVVPSVRAAVARFDGSLAVGNPTALALAIARDTAQPRFNTLVLMGFSALATSLAAVGVYGLLAYSVARRTREIGVRLAMGARPEQITRLVVGEGMALIAAGSTLGLLGSVFAGRLLSALLFGVEPGDTLSFFAGTFTLLVVGLAATYVPARTASRVAPATALRNE